MSTLPPAEFITLKYKQTFLKSTYIPSEGLGTLKAKKIFHINVAI